MAAPTLPLNPSFSFTDTASSCNSHFVKLLQSAFPQSQSQSPGLDPSDTLIFSYLPSPSTLNHIPTITPLGSKQTLLNLYNSSTLSFPTPLSQRIAPYLPPTYLSSSLPPNPLFSPPFTGPIWILKPFKSCNGLNLQLAPLPSVPKLSQGMGGRIVQKYVEKPFLLGSKKFDVRQWVLIVTTPASVKVYIHHTCYLRVCVSDYDLSDLNDGSRHFTNLKVSGGKAGCYVSEGDFEMRLERDGRRGKWKGFKEKMEECVLASVETTEVERGRWGYELLGYDFLVTEEMEPLLLEVNVSPGLRKERGGVNVEREIERMLEGVWNLTIGDWYDKPVGDRGAKVWKELRGLSAYKFRGGVEREIEGLGIVGVAISEAEANVVDKRVGADASFIIIQRNVRSYVSRKARRMRARTRITSFTQKSWRGRRCRRRLLMDRSVVVIVRFMRLCKDILARWRKRKLFLESVWDGGRVLESSMYRRMVRRGFGVMKARWSTLRKVKLSLDFQGRVLVMQRCLRQFLGYSRAKRIIAKSVYEVLIVRRRELKETSSDAIARAYKAHALRKHLRIAVERSAERSRALTKIRNQIALRDLGKFVNVCKKCLRKRRLEKIIEDVEREKREEELRVLMEGERKRLIRERKKLERARREEEAIRELELELAEKKRVGEERRKVVEAKALTFGVKSVKTLRVVGEHELLLRELEECMEGTPKAKKKQEQEEEEEEEERVSFL